METLKTRSSSTSRPVRTLQGADRRSDSPLDVVKTRLMTQGGMKGKTRYYKGVMDCVTRTVAEEGWIALLKGISPE